MMSLLALSKYIITMLITEHKMTPLHNSSGPRCRVGSYLLIFTRNGSIKGSRKKYVLLRS